VTGDAAERRARILDGARGTPCYVTGVDPTTSRALVDAHADAMVRLFVGPA
jgi:hypothetical protein